MSNKNFGYEYKKEKVVYLSDRTLPKKKKKFKILNILLALLIVYFGVAIVKQEFKLAELKKQTQELDDQLNKLVQQDDVLNKQIENLEDDNIIENKAKTILGWISEDEIKVLPNK